MPSLLILLTACMTIIDLCAEPLHLLVFTKTTGFRHASIEAGVDAMVKLAADKGYLLDHSEDAAIFNTENISQFDVIIFLNTTGDILNEDQQRVMESFIQNGGGFVGVHSATDTEYDWPWYGKLVGAYFESHPKVQEASMQVLDASHLSTVKLPEKWIRTDEWYNFKDLNPQVHVLINLDESTYDGGKNGLNHPFAWCHEFDGGRAFYTLGGHAKESFSEESFLAHLLGGIQYAAGKNPVNTLTSEEIQEGWKLLFDGKTTAGWRNYQSNSIGSSWIVEDGSLTLQVESAKNGRTKAKDGGDIVSIDQYENFELSLEWKIAACGNSGILFNVNEDGTYKRPYHTGPEMQILDNACHPDAKIHTHRAGDLYDMIACNTEMVKAAGEWNHVLIRIVSGQGEFVLNGTQVITFTMFDDDWKSMIDGSKFKAMPGFGKFKKGHLCLQDHGDEVSFRNMKIRIL